eukprot:TRINITY_DN60828_c0_g1_i1.p1 TRINITY_DN60828_c0_g1~~TRINITY_DN60828_c0_g1_i1.p1  ORF type:complete len:245 (-),score=13.23 TRINITY_DN60828_c0_g1_i1:38-772(-)
MSRAVVSYSTSGCGGSGVAASGCGNWHYAPIARSEYSQLAPTESHVPVQHVIPSAHQSSALSHGRPPASHQAVSVVRAAPLVSAPCIRSAVRPVGRRAKPFKDPLSGLEFGDMYDPMERERIAAAMERAPKWRGFRAAAQNRRTAEGLPHFDVCWVDGQSGHADYVGQAVHTSVSNVTRPCGNSRPPSPPRSPVGTIVQHHATPSANSPLQESVEPNETVYSQPSSRLKVPKPKKIKKKKGGCC